MALPVSLWKKILAADSDRFSRLHDGQGNIVSFAEVAALPIRVLEHFRLSGVNTPTALGGRGTRLQQSMPPSHPKPV